MHRDRNVAPGAGHRPIRNALRTPRRALIILALCGFFLLLAAGCGRSQSAITQSTDSYQVSFATDPAEPNQGEGTVIVTIKDGQGQAVDAARVSIEANMNHAGMTPENAEVTTGTAGEYRLPVNWTMGGEWYVDVKIALRDGAEVLRRFPVNVK